MTKVNCLNPISELGTGLFNDNYEMTDIYDVIMDAVRGE